MTDKANSTYTHDGNDLTLKVDDAESGLENAQDEMMLINPADLESGFTHSQDKPELPGATKAPTTAAVKTSAKKPVVANGAMSEPLVDKDVDKGGKIAEIDNEMDPSAGYLEKESGMPVVNNASVEDDGLGEDDDVGAGFPSAEEETEVNSEFDDMAEGSGETVADEDEFEDLDVGEPAAEAPVAPVAEAPVEEVADFEAAPVEDAAPLVDVDEVPNTEGSDPLVFASVGNNLHVIRSNRIIASIGPARARKLNIADVYMTEQFQDVVAHAVDTRGLRAGLVKQGFILAKVKMTASKANAKVVSAKVEAGIKSKLEAIAQRDKALEQSLAIAVVGINKRYFSKLENVLRASIEDELKKAGVRNASRMLSACFSEHGVAYAKSILTLANKIAAMPEEVRNNHAESLDLTSDEDFMDEDEDMIEGSDACMEEDEGEFEPITSVTAALSSPRNQSYNGMIDPSRQKQSVQASSIPSLLLSNQSLV